MDNLRIGRISSVNYENGTAKVVYSDRSDSVTNDLPFFDCEYSMPSVGTPVVVGHFSNGSEKGFILGRLYSEVNKPFECGRGVFKKEFAKVKDKAFIRYDDNEETLDIVLNTQKKISIHLNGKTGEIIFSADKVKTTEETSL